MISNLKHQFMLDPDVTFLNHGSFGACAKPVYEDLLKWQKIMEKEPVKFFEESLYDALKISLHEKIEAHSDYTAEQKFELNKIIDEALKDHKELKIEESKTVQLLMDSLLSENNDLKKINALKKKMANIYDRKTKLLYKTSSKIKKLPPFSITLRNAKECENKTVCK